MSCTGAVELRGRRRSTRWSPRSPPRGSPSAARPAPTTASRRPRWRTASARATSRPPMAVAARIRAVRFATAGLGRRRQVHADRAAAVRLQADPRGPARARRARSPSAAATATRTSRCSPTACAPSASRASRSTSPTATSRRRGASSSSPTRPGHEQYTRNMVTGASTADLALVLVDARKRRARAVAPPRVHRRRCCGIPHLVVCVNKMDLVDCERGAPSSAIAREFTGFARSSTCTDMTFIPISALHGDNVVDRSREHALVPGPVAALPPRARPHGVRPQPRGRALPRPVGRPPDVRRAPRLPRLRRPGRLGRASASATRSWSCRRARRPGSPAIDTYDGELEEAYPAAVGHAAARGRHRRLARRHDLPPAQPARRVARARRDGLLDGGAPAAAGRPLPHQAHDAHACSPRRTTSATAST